MNNNMNKKDLENLIAKYYLQGQCNSVKWAVDNNNLNINFTTEDASMLGNIDANFELGDKEFGIYDTKTLLSLLASLDPEIDINYDYQRNTLTGLRFNDKVVDVTFMLADLSVIPESRTLKQLPDFDVEVQLKKDFTDRFIRSKKALPEAKVVALIPGDNEIDFVINYSQTNTNRISISVKCQIINNDFNLIGFNAELLALVLSANTDYREATLKVSKQGLMAVEFVNEDCTSKYYFKSIEL